MRILKKIRFDQKIIIFIFFLFISTLLWFLNALEKKYTTKISYPVKFYNFPKDKVLLNDLPTQFELEINSYGYVLLKYKISHNFIPLRINVSNLSLSNLAKQDSSKVYILTEYINHEINEQLNSDIKLSNIKPDTLIFKFTPIKFKHLPIKFNYNINFKKQYSFKDSIKINPDSVTVSGPGVIIDTLNYIKTEYIEISDLNKTLNIEIKLQDIENLSYSTNLISIEIPVEEYTEKKVSIPISVTNLPDSLDLIIFPDEVSIFYKVGFSNYGKINNEKFEAIVDYSDIKNNLSNNLKIQIISVPENINSHRLSTGYVEYLIEKK